MCIRSLDRLDQLEQKRNFTLKLENVCLTASFLLFAFFLFFPFLQTGKFLGAVDGSVMTQLLNMGMFKK